MGTGNKPDFSNVQGGVRSTEAERPDFSNVQGGVRSTEEMVDPPEQTYTVEKVLHPSPGKAARILRKK